MKSYISGFWYYNARIKKIRKCRNIFRCMIDLNKFNNPILLWFMISRAPRVRHICQRCVVLPSKSHQNLMARLSTTAAWCSYFTKYNFCAISCKQMKTYENESLDITKYYIVFVCAPNRIKLTADSISPYEYDADRFCCLMTFSTGWRKQILLVCWRGGQFYVSKFCCLMTQSTRVDIGQWCHPISHDNLQLS